MKPSLCRRASGSIAVLALVASACIRTIDLAEVTDGGTSDASVFVDTGSGDHDSSEDSLHSDAGESAEVSLQSEASLLVDAESDADADAALDAD